MNTSEAQPYQRQLRRVLVEDAVAGSVAVVLVLLPLSEIWHELLKLCLFPFLVLLENRPELYSAPLIFIAASQFAIAVVVDVVGVISGRSKTTTRLYIYSMTAAVLWVAWLVHGNFLAEVWRS